MKENILNEYGLVAYDSYQLSNWNNSKKIVIYNGSDSFLDFIKNAFEKKNLSKKLYFGKISQELAARIKSVSNLTLTNFNVSLSANEIRKIAINSHGNKEREVSRGQIPITSEILLQAPLIITEADEIKLSQRKFNEKPVLIFRKMLHGKITVVAYVSTSKQDLAILTMYATKKGTSATPTND